MRVGVFGGSFDPPHVGHLIIAQEAWEQAGLDLVVFLPSPSPPHKDERFLSPFPVRMAMVRAAVEGDHRFMVWDLEATLPPPHFTVRTLQEVKRQRPSWERLYLIIGSDSLLDFPTWYQPHEVIRLASLVVYPRPGFPVCKARDEYLAHAQLLHSAELPVSSTDLRQRVRQGRSVRYWVPDGVLTLISQHGLYQRGDPDG